MMEEIYKKVLALDSSGLVASVAVVEGDGYNSNLLAEYTDTPAYAGRDCEDDGAGSENH